jgi:thioesterase domain-containing protein
VARGYLGRPALTAERFVPDPFSRLPGARLYRTGDRARWRPEGTLEFLGRLDEQAKVRGFRVEPGEVEAALRRHPGVRDCAVVARADASGHTRLAAYVVPADAPDAGELRAFLRERLPEHMVPSLFQRLPAFPLTPGGKVDRRALPEPGPGRPELARGYAPPRTAAEEALAAAWAEVLGVDRVGVHDDWFDLGGTSISALRVIHRGKRHFARELTLRAFFHGPTVAQMAAALQAGEGGEAWSPLVRIHAGGGKPPLFLVHPAGGNVLCYAPLARCFAGERPVYGLEAGGADAGESVEDMGARYAAAIRAAHPGGPYLVGGWSVGGVIAWEVARQLAEAGGAVEMVFLVDTAAAGRYPEPDEALLLDLLARDLEAPAANRGDAPGEPARARSRLLAELGPERMERAAAGYRRVLGAVWRHQPRPAPLPLLYFAAAPPGQLPGDDAARWTALARGPWRVCRLLGGHYEVLGRPAAIAEQLRRGVAPSPP